ncbi:hypothetical protein [Embleya sp. NPDC050493]|uniref:hypothetical protein n=1 Tax=Embleya sp. NPDC050493 TaxID=3363989 RepID=UPI003796A30F
MKSPRRSRTYAAAAAAVALTSVVAVGTLTPAASASDRPGHGTPSTPRPTCALSLHATGFRPRVSEVARTIEAVGVGINLLPHADIGWGSGSFPGPHERRGRPVAKRGLPQ